MRLNGLGALEFDVRSRTDCDVPKLQLRIGPFHFSLNETEALALANRLVDTVERHRRNCALRADQ